MKKILIIYISCILTLSCSKNEDNNRLSEDVFTKDDFYIEFTDNDSTTVRVENENELFIRSVTVYKNTDTLADFFVSAGYGANIGNGIEFNFNIPNTQLLCFNPESLSNMHQPLDSIGYYLISHNGLSFFNQTRITRKVDTNLFIISYLKNNNPAENYINIDTCFIAKYSMFDTNTGDSYITDMIIVEGSFDMKADEELISYSGFDIVSHGYRGLHRYKNGFFRFGVLKLSVPR
ncbi:MAG: hypothetical protein KAX69_02210 [Chitinophagales bacterium]|nr:hypothetical protein [Chitinophagales bacterium]